MITEAFPTKMRGVGVGVSWNVATSVFGGLGPLFCAHMATKDKLAPAYYLAACFFLGLARAAPAPLAAHRDPLADHCSCSSHRGARLLSVSRPQVSISTAKLLQTRGLATFSNIRPHKY